MGKLEHYKRVRLTDIADIERTVKGKIYPAGTIYIQVSACRKGGLQQFFMLKENGELANKYAVIMPKIKIYPPYLVEILNLNADEFMHRYVGSNINIQLESFAFFQLDIHEDYDTTVAIGNYLMAIDQVREEIEKKIAAEKQLRAYLLDGMFAH